MSGRVPSFTACLRELGITSRQLRREGARFSTFVLDSKLAAYRFVSQMGISTPEVYQRGVSIDEIVFRPGSVVKPEGEDSARGVFVVHKEDKIRYIHSGVEYSSASKAANYARQLLSRKMVKSDVWMCEQMLGAEGEIARDLKFYCFYGQVGLVLESQRIPKVRRCWYSADGEYVRTGKYDDSLFEGDKEFGIELELAKKISLEIPSPFARLDFLSWQGKAYFGEVTPQPSAYNTMNDEWDQKLGTMFISASVRLANDVAYGKTFKFYKSLIEGGNSPVS